MRVRKRNGAEELIANHPQYVVDEPQKWKGRWAERFGNENPIHTEIGMGKGQFIFGMAKANPEINYIGIDIQLSVVSYALDKLIAEEVPNLQLLRVDGSDLTNYFADSEVDQIYLNFSDPWPKKRHAKRRLTYKTFLANYQDILKDQGAIELKTDNMGFFEFSLQSMNNYGMHFDGVWLDLHNSEENKHNVETEYEQKFAAKGQPIYKLTAHFE